MTLEEEKRFALLASVLDLGGHGRKDQVLDNIESKGYLRFDDHDLQDMPNRNELFWRNDLAYIRKHLVVNRHFDGSRFNNWEITEKGRNYFMSLGGAARASGLHVRPRRSLTAAARRKRIAGSWTVAVRRTVICPGRASVPLPSTNPVPTVCHAR
jgi:hypothetical protein